MTLKDLPMKIHLKGKWRTLFTPEKLCSYVNDHTFFVDKKHQWRMLGTCGNGPYNFLLEYFFIDCQSKSSLAPMHEVRKVFHRHLKKPIKISPFVFFDKKTKKYHLYYGHRNILHYSSDDGEDWKAEKPAIRSSWPYLRDPHVIEYADNYLMYVTDINNKIAVFRSRDLHQWKRNGVAFKLGQGVPKSVNSACESPFVLKYKDYYLLFTTIVPSPFGRRHNYLNTFVFASRDPLHFGKYSSNGTNTAKLVAKLETHAPEIIEKAGKLYITTCGWKRFPKPKGVNGEGIYFRELKIDVRI